jgi:dolichyl-phosphate beta-glucosyltransferase
MIKSISIILPIFNEEKRIKENLIKIKKFNLTKFIKIKEFILVNDGSTDSTKNIIDNFIKKDKKAIKNLKLINHKKNLGKGAALKTGIKKAKNQWILTSDIDFSVSLFELKNWIEKYIQFKKKDEIVFFGSRAHNKSIVNSKFYRKIIGYFLSKIIFYFLNIEIKDTQCGFKLYKKKIAKKLFSLIISKGFEHDIELTLILKKNNIKIIELPITWTHKEFSKVDILLDSIKILKSIYLFKNKFN